MTPEYDVIVIGGGPAGLNASLVLGRCCRSVLVIDAGQPRNRAARELHGMLGHDGTPPARLREVGRAQAAHYGVAFTADEALDAVPTSTSASNTQFLVTTSAGARFLARKLLLATGIADELPAIDGVAECYGISVHHCPYCDAWEHRDKRIGVLARRVDDAIGLALGLRTWSEHVTVLSNGLTATAEERHELESHAIGLVQARIRRLRHQDGKLRAVGFEGDPSEAPFEALFFDAAKEPASPLAERLGCDFASADRVATGKKQSTRVAGVFVAGDAAAEVQFVVVAAAEGAAAAVAINRELQEEDGYGRGSD